MGVCFHLLPNESWERARRRLCAIARAYMFARAATLRAQIASSVSASRFRFDKTGGRGPGFVCLNPVLPEAKIQITPPNGVNRDLSCFGGALVAKSCVTHDFSRLPRKESKEKQPITTRTPRAEGKCVLEMHIESCVGVQGKSERSRRSARAVSKRLRTIARKSSVDPRCSGARVTGDYYYYRYSYRSYRRGSRSPTVPKNERLVRLLVRRRRA